MYGDVIIKEFIGILNVNLVFIFFRLFIFVNDFFIGFLSN